MVGTSLKAKELSDILRDRFYLPDHLGDWMVLWTERIFREPDGSVAADIALVRLDEGYKSISFSKIDFRQLRVISVPIKLLSIISPGVLFQDGDFNLDKIYELASPFKLKIDASKATHLQVSNWELGSEFRKRIGLTRTDLAWSSGRRNSFGEKSNIMVIVNSDSSLNAKYIVYPCNEIARFYLFRSSKLIKALITPFEVSKKDNVLYNPTSLKIEDGYKFFVIREEMNYSDAPYLARIAFSQRCKQAVDVLQVSLLNSTVFGQFNSSCYLNTVFPFEGETIHEVYGISVPIGDINIFLILEITECYAEFPFTSLRFSKENEYPEIDKNRQPIPGVGTSRHLGDQGPKLKTKTIYHYEPTFDKDLTRNNRIGNDPQINDLEYVVRKVRFPNLTTDIIRVKIDPVPPKHEYGGVTHKHVSNLSLSELKEKNSGSTGLNVSSGEYVLDYKTPGNYLDFIRLMVEYYRSIGCEVSFHNGNTEEGVFDFDTILMNIITSDRGLSKNEFNFSHMPDKLPRRAVVFQVKYANQYVLVMEFEPIGRNAYHAFQNENPKTSFSFSDVSLLLETAITSQGSFKDLPELYVRKRFYHENTSPEHHALKILSAFGYKVDTKV
ncbi:MAG TPA: hypothetical protein PLV21_04945 [Cyclobacteriaceae bacterium]|nr:hypothetical protein [Cyclobacteriaceae bacterium]HRJ81206.1 hypothetical protein [Cyclobacteriaceae bacterium]